MTSQHDLELATQYLVITRGIARDFGHQRDQCLEVLRTIYVERGGDPRIAELCEGIFQQIGALRGRLSTDRSVLMEILADWVLTEDQLPPRGTKVLAAYHNKLGMARLVVGEYVRRFDVESTEEDCEVDEYSDVYDAYYLREGWYEQHDNLDEYASILITEGKVTHWMPLPKLPFKEDSSVHETEKSYRVHSRNSRTGETRTGMLVSLEKANVLVDYCNPLPEFKDWIFWCEQETRG